MEKQNIIREKTFDFAVRIVMLCKVLSGERKEFVISKQLLRSGTSIGANVEEAIGGVSDKDFTNKFGIAYKESRETIYWLRLLHATDYLDHKEFESMESDADEICKILGKIRSTMIKRMK